MDSDIIFAFRYDAENYICETEVKVVVLSSRTPGWLNKLRSINYIFVVLNQIMVSFLALSIDLVYRMLNLIAILKV